MPNNAVKSDTLNKYFNVGDQEIHVLKDISVEIQEGEFCIIVGPSGCGKSTLLHIILGLEAPTSGSLTFLGTNLYESSTEDDRSDFRKQHIGMIYQQPNWVKSMSVVENVAFPLLMIGQPRQLALESARKQLENVNLLEWQDYIPTELSSGQQQRVALARGLANDPQVIIADEPTGNLDFESGQMMMELLARLNTENKKTVIMVTHDLEYLTFGTKAIRMLDGAVTKVYDKKSISTLMKEVKSKRGI
ncbi:MAG: ABC transporter ATP-binding protein [bacterium]|nr:ABC transporter ATP-binding protein [bacterium]